MNKNERTLYQDIPVGRFHSAILTSFTFDIAHFDNQVLNLLRGKRICSYNILVDQLQLNSSINFNSGALRKVGKDYAITGIKSQGAFHPKLSYFVGDDSVLLLFGSGNLTVPGHGKNHELFSGFYINKEDSLQLPFLQEAWDYLSSFYIEMGGYTCKRVTKEIPQNCSFKLKEKVMHHIFQTIDEDTDAALVYNEEGNSIFNQLQSLLPKDIITITVVSPFFDKDGGVLLELHELFPYAEINVLLQTKCLLPPNKLKNNSKIHFYDFDQTKRGKNDSFGNFRYERNLHAKIFHFETDREEYVMIGSANATIAAIGGKTKKPINNEFGALYRSSTRKFLKELGLSEKKRLKIRVNDMERAENMSEDETKLPINLISIDAIGDNMTLYLANLIKSIDVQLVGYNIDNGPKTLAKFHVDSKQKNIKLKVSLPADVMYCALTDDDGNLVSNFQYVNQIEKLNATNPSKENRDINKMLAKIESGNYSGLEIVEFIDDLICNIMNDNIRLKNNKGSSDFKATTNDRIGHYNAKYDTDKEENEVFDRHPSTISRLLECMESAVKEKIYTINEELKGEEDEANAIESNNREAVVRQNIKIDSDKLDVIIDSVCHFLASYNILIDQRIKEHQRFPERALNRQDLEFLAATTFAVLDFCLFSSDFFDFSSSDDPAGDKYYLLEYLSDIVKKNIPSIINNFTFFAIRAQSTKMDEETRFYAHRTMRYIVLGLCSAISKMTETDYNYYISNIELTLVNLFDIFGVPNYSTIEDTIDHINEVYERGIRKDKVKSLFDRCKNTNIDNINYKRWKGYGIGKAYKGRQHFIEIQQLRKI